MSKMANKNDNRTANVISSSNPGNATNNERNDDLYQTEGGDNGQSNTVATSEGVVIGALVVPPQGTQITRQVSLPGAFRVTPGARMTRSIAVTPHEPSTDEDNSDPEDLNDRAAGTSNDEEAASDYDCFHDDGIQVEATLFVEPPVYEALRISPEAEVSEVREGVKSEKEPTRPFFTFIFFGKRFSFSKRFCLLAALTAVALVGVVVAVVIVESNKVGAQPSKDDFEDPTQDEPTDPIQDNRFDDIQPTIAQLSGSEVLENMESPQYKALDWIANKDGANVPIWDTLRIVQRYILAVIYYSTGGEEWTDNYGFLTDSHECEWSDETATMGVDGCHEDYVTSLDFFENNLDGTFPTEIGHLTNLTFFRSLSTNIAGTIPTEFGLLTKMKFFSLVQNENLKGHIPSELGNFQSVNEFWLNSNSLSGSIPSELGQLTTAKYFSLRDNDLTGEIPTSLANIKEGLISFELYHNHLNGSAEFFCENATGTFILSVDKSDVSCSCCGCCD